MRRKRKRRRWRAERTGREKIKRGEVEREVNRGTQAGGWQ